MAEFVQPSDPLSTCGDEEVSWTQRAFTDHMHLSQVPAKASVTGTSQGITDLSQPCKPSTCNKLYLGAESSRKGRKARYEADVKAVAATESQQICNRKLMLSSQMVARLLQGELTRLLLSFGSSSTFCHCPGHCNILMCHLQVHIYAFKGKQDP